MIRVSAVFFVLVTALCVFLKSQYVIHGLGSQYRKAWHIFHYDYYGIDSPEYVKRLSYSEKIVCHRDHYDQAMADFLDGKSQPERKLLHFWKRRRAESLWIGDRRYVIKTGTHKGFFCNLLKMGLGVEIWNNAIFAKKLGIRTLKPVALWEKRTLSRVESIVLYPWEGTSGDQAFKKNLEFLPEVEKLLEQLKKLSVIHRSFRLKNLVVMPDGKPQLIDIDEIHQFPKYSFIYHKRMHCETRNYGKDILRLSNFYFSRVGRSDEQSGKGV